MLILAGVSLNAIIGENGVITNAANAKLKNSMAVLQEFLQERYFSAEIDQTSEISNNNNVSKLEELVKYYPEWFFTNGVNNYVLVEYSHKGDDGVDKLDYLKLRLIDKNGLSKNYLDISKQLDYGNAKTREDFLNLKDVYGVTSDLEVFYCSDGLKSVVGANYINSDFFDGNQVLYGKDTSLSKALSNTTGKESKDLTISDLYSIQDLQITKDDGCSDLMFLYDVPNVTKLTLKSYNGSMKGIEALTKLNSLKIDNGSGDTKIDYTNFRFATTISQLEFYMPTDVEIDNMTKEMANGDYENLATIGLYGWTGFTLRYDYQLHTDNLYSANRSSYSNLDYLNRLSPKTKHAIKTMYLQNNQISTINLDFNSDNGFNSVSGFHIFCNNITSSIGLKNAISLSDVSICYNPITEINDLPINKLNALRIYNTDITTLYSLVGNKISFLDAYNLENLDFDDPKWSSEAKESIGKIPYLILHSNYALTFSNSETLNIPSHYESDKFETDLKNNEYVVSLSLGSNKNLTNSAIQNVLSTLPKLEYLDVSGTKIENLTCFANYDGLVGINICDTSITDLSPLLKSANNGLIALQCNNQNIEMNDSNYDIISKVMDKKTSMWGNAVLGYIGGVVCPNITLLKKLEGKNLSVFYSNMSKDVSGTLDLSGCTNLSYVCARYSNNLKILLPENVGEVYLWDGGASFELPKGKTIPFINLQSASYSNVNINGGNVIKVKANAKEQEVKSQYLSSWLYDVNPSVLEVTEQSSNNSNSFYPDDFLSGYTELTSLSWTKVNLRDVSLLKTLKSSSKLTTINLSSNKISNLDSFKEIYDENQTKVVEEGQHKNLEQVTTLNLSSNSLSTLKGLFPEVVPNLSDLDLSNNMLLENVITVIKSDGTSQTVKTADFLATFNNLKKINLQKTGVTDFDALIKAGFKNNNGILTKN